MLPSSHFAPIKASLADCDCLSHVIEHTDELQTVQSSQRQDNSEDESGKRARSAQLLASEFSEFISSASRLENSYRALQVEVSILGLELSERNAALHASLSENERMRLALQQIVDSMPCGVLVVARDGKISMINPESWRLLGLDPAQVGEESKTTIQQISVVSGVHLEASFLDESISESEQEYMVCSSSGNRWIEVRNRRLFHNGVQSGRPDQTILILRDITAQKRAEEEREAGRKAMALAELTTILAHEIRNPLASLELFAELIETDGVGRGQWISNLRAGIRSLSGTVNNVLSFHGSSTLALTPLNLPALIDDAIQFALPLADQADVSLKCLIECERAIVMGNEGALRQVVLNLVSNAIRHTPAGGSVTASLSAKKEGGENYVVEFCDTGCGIRPDQMEHLFEPGFSGSGDTTGLGLSVCERIMKQHNGRISASNAANAGARFTLQFPALHEELASR
jgi:PAS domain S-box-containing protein